MITIPNLMSRYNIKSRQGIVQWVKRHLDEINADGVHASIVKGEWMFDRKAVEIMDKLRGFGDTVVLQDLENEKLAAAMHECNQYKLLVMQKQEEISQLQQQIIVMQGKMMEIQPKYKLAEHTARVLQQRNQQLGTELDALKEKNEGIIRELQVEKEKNDRLRNRSFWARLMNRVE